MRFWSLLQDHLDQGQTLADVARTLRWMQRVCFLRDQGRATAISYLGLEAPGLVYTHYPLMGTNTPKGRVEESQRYRLYLQDDLLDIQRLTNMLHTAYPSVEGYITAYSVLVSHGPERYGDHRDTVPKPGYWQPWEGVIRVAQSFHEALEPGTVLARDIEAWPSVSTPWVRTIAHHDLLLDQHPFYPNGLRVRAKLV